MRMARALVTFPKLLTANVTARVIELRVVEYVEEFTSNLERLRFGDWDDLLDA